MMTGTDTMGKTPIERLTELGQMRVWSLIVTIFGDAVLPRGGTAPSTALAELTSEIGIRPEAFRVALSRLTRDGWIERSRAGRRSFYRLSKTGLATFGPASERIYAPAPAQVDRWQIVVPAQSPPAGHVEIAPRVWLGPASADESPEGAPEDALRVCGRMSLPDWARENTAEPDVVAGYKTLAATLGAVADRIAAEPPAGVTAAAIRTLVIHQWRRLVLRHGDWPAEVFPPDWQGETCRHRVLALLEALDPAARDWFDARITTRPDTGKAGSPSADAGPRRSAT